MLSKYICICILQNISTKIYSQLNSTKNINLNILEFLFRTENHVCHTLVWNELGKHISLILSFADVGTIKKILRTPTPFHITKNYQQQIVPLKIGTI